MEKDSQFWLPVWITLPIASKACIELVKCGCKSTMAAMADVLVRRPDGGAPSFVAVNEKRRFPEGRSICFTAIVNPVDGT